jgi:hypothetical protein
METGLRRIKNKEMYAVRPNNLGWIEYRLDSQEMDYIWRCIENKKRDWRSTLAGHVSGSYELIDRGDWFYNNTLLPLCDNYAKEFENLGLNLGTTGTHPYHLKSMWVNYQKQNEFNPLHDHSGVYSFVIWMKIPFNWKVQNSNALAAAANNEKISTFQFQFLNILGRNLSWDYKLSTEDEGAMVFFPSGLQHQVYPFYNCDEERISVSGNISINTAKRV